MKCKFELALGLIFTFSITVYSHASFAGCNTVKPGEVAFFQDSKYRGSCVIRKIGRYSNSKAIGIGNDKISSIKVGSNTQVSLCKDSNFKGGCRIYTKSTASLGKMNDKTSSAVIIAQKISATRTPTKSGFTSGNYVDHGEGGCKKRNSYQIVVYLDKQLQGTCAVLGVGRYDNALSMRIPNDSISSVLIGKNVEALLCKDVNLRGGCLLAEPNTAPSLGRKPGVTTSLRKMFNNTTDFNDAISSIRVRRSDTNQ